MTSFSSGSPGDGAGGAQGAQGAGGGSVFVGSFNINSQDLTIEDARAWLKEAKDADIIALGLQECATVPANPFPEPTNGKAIAMWKEVKHMAVAEAIDRSTCSARGSGDGAGNGSRWGSLAMAGVVQDALSAARATRNAKQARTNGPPSHAATAVGSQSTCRADSRGSSSNSAGGGGSSWNQGRGMIERGLSSGLESSAPVLLGDTKRGGDGHLVSSSGMRQESYYLRGPVEPERDEKLLATIATCIPGRRLVADVAMGETPTHGKIKVNISRNVSSNASSRDVSSSSSSSTAAAAVEAAMASSCCPRECGDGSVEGSDTVAGDGPLDASGRPGWSVGDSGKGGLGDSSTNGDADGSGDVFKTVEWYGTIRLLVFVRNGLYKDLSVRTVVIPAGDKPSVVADAPEDYAKDTSPDKGAVVCYLEDPSSQSPLQLLLVNCHLYGTNKYGVKEAVFDKYRSAQLRAIDLALRATLPTATMAPLVLLGDLNFRVELRSGAEDKSKGGNDFQKVREMAETSDPKALLDLYYRADRLRPLLEGQQSDQDQTVERDSPFTTQRGEAGRAASGEEQQVQQVTAMPSFLTGLKDGLRQSLANGQAVRPTFTFKPGDTSSTPRRYNDKRTPSWTDRILWRGFKDDTCYHSSDQQVIEDHSRHSREVTQQGGTSSSTFAAVQDVIASDHEPVYCVLHLPLQCNTPTT